MEAEKIRKIEGRKSIKRGMPGMRSREWEREKERARGEGGREERMKGGRGWRDS